MEKGNHRPPQNQVRNRQVVKIAGGAILAGCLGLYLFHDPAHPMAWNAMAIAGLALIAFIFMLLFAFFSQRLHQCQNTIHDLRKSQGILSNILDAVPQAVFWKNRNSVYLGCNQVFVRTLGMDRPDQIIGKNDLELPWPPALAAAYRSDDREVMENNLPKSHIIEPFQRADGTRQWVDTNKVPLIDDAGQVYGILGVFEEITERIKSQEMLSLTQQHLQQLIENAPFGAHQYELKPDSRLVFTGFNRAANRILGVDCSHFIGQTIETAFPPLAQTRVPEAYRNVAAAGQRYDEEQVTYTHGQITGVFEISAFQTIPNCMAVFFRDITERRKAEIALQQSEENFRLLATNSTDLISRHTPDGVYLYASPASKDLLGYEPGELVGRSAYAFVPPESQTVLDQATSELLSSPSAITVRFQANHKDGHSLWLESTAHAIRDEKTGRIVELQISSRDVTKRMQAEEALRRENLERRQIEENLRKSKDLMHQQAAQLIEADKRKDEFLAMLAHELRNPLGPIRTTVELLRMQDRFQDPETRKGFELINRQVNHLAHIVGDLLDTSRISRNLISLKKEWVDLSGIIEQVVDANLKTAEARNKPMKTDLPAVPIRLWADPVRLVQILSNLLNNAFKFTPEQGAITLSARQEAGQAIIEVADTGIGITPDILPNIFDLFYQADKSLDRAKGGLGLGLTLVKKLTDLHQGTVQAFSPGVNQGSRFVLRLPLGAAAEYPAPAEGGALPEKPHPADGLRLLVVEDNIDAAESLSEVLRFWGYQVWLSHEGNDAVLKALTIHPDVVLLDIGLPGVDGYQVCSRLHAEPSLSETLTVALTGYNPKGPDQQRGFYRYLTKPVELDTLEKLLADIHHAADCKKKRP